MKRFSEQLHTKSQSITLSSAEKAQLQERLVSYMEYHPLPAHLKTAKKLPASQGVLESETFFAVRIPFAWFIKSATAAAVFVLLIVPFMAERSVPGDSLYAVKVQFNEEVRSSLIFDTVDKVEWETERVNRRIAEARLLASEGRLTEEVEAEVAQAVLTHTQNAQREIALLRETDAEQAAIASIAFDSTLEAQATSLKEDEDQDAVLMTAELASLDTKVAAKANNLIAKAVNDSRALNEKPNASSTPSYAKLMARAEIDTTRMYELRDSIAGRDSEAHAGITRRIEDIERSILSAIEKSSVSESESQQILISVLQRSQKMIVFMTDLEVSQTVDINELVPLVLTEEESAAQIAEYNAELESKVQQIQSVLESDTLTKDGVKQKAEKGLEDIETLREQMKNTPEFIGYQALVTEAIEIAADLLKTFERTDEQSPVGPADENPASTTATSGAETIDASSTPATTSASSSIDA